MVFLEVCGIIHQALHLMKFASSILKPLQLLWVVAAACIGLLAIWAWPSFAENLYSFGMIVLPVINLLTSVIVFCESIPPIIKEQVPDSNRKLT
ncbi:Regulatory protein AtoC [Frankliniella fusca]|uniref:Regulatory protein AtoC n=1 Tax=Frankliniella fusca TaxID=407009 RepID=A0AAE1HMA1_9NEOP|nr:Regulatory protein AtoC [Frankliniella fusca]KAK3916517.1 Regulatory protein AtoC [Frankliniella fusca]KAK3916589.1 Regulatory protein AtoC [Frankliniella fusca]KAK3922721.1 Regulatory protein AtoC [Frankliniella fusca]KAK3922795.1 Regulatory protein AtoC [Frankliniella fusca]